MMTPEKKQNKLLFLIPIGCCVVLILLVLTLSGCQTSSIDDLGVSAPQALTLPEPAPATTTPPPTQTGYTTDSQRPIAPSTSAANTGQYPVIGRTRSGETSQLTKSETDAIREELRRASENSPRRANSVSTSQVQSELEALRRKARSHGKKALEKIEDPAG